ncbi:hypothetical protein H8D57_00955 [bacterium]|nr:hypothetical protein [bacterium]
MKRKQILKRLPLILLSMTFLLSCLIGCGEAPTNSPAAIIDEGSIEVKLSVETSSDNSFEPDSIGIFVDGLLLGDFPNPTVFREIRSGSHLVKCYFEYENLKLMSENDTNRVFYDSTSFSHFNIQVGSLVVTCLLNDANGDTISPDSVGVILDDDSLHTRKNPVNIAMLGVGDHTISTYTSLDSIFYISTTQNVSIEFDSISTLKLPIEVSSEVVITGFWDGGNRELPEFGLIFDDIDHGVVASPRIITGISAGNHSAMIWTKIDTFKLQGWMPEFEVEFGASTRIVIEATHVCPTVGFHAPDYTATDIDQMQHQLSDNWGKVIYLYFFRST